MTTEIFANNWKALAWRGAFGILFGIGVLAVPNIALGAFLIAFGFYCIFDGTLSIASGIRRYKDEQRWGVPVVAGVLSLIMGAITFAWPIATVMAWVFLAGAWSIMRGIFEISAAITLRRELQGEFWLGVAGLISAAFGAWILLRPIVGVFALVMVVGLASIFYGSAMIAFSFRLRHTLRSLEQHRARLSEGVIEIKKAG